MRCVLSLEKTNLAKQRFAAVLSSENESSNSLLLYDKDSKQVSARLLIDTLDLHVCRNSKPTSDWQKLPLEVLDVQNEIMYARVHKTSTFCCRKAAHYYVRAYFAPSYVNVTLLRCSRRLHSRYTPCLCVCTPFVCLNADCERDAEREIVSQWTSSVFDQWN